MSTVDDVVKSLESVAVKTAVTEVMSYLAANVWVGFSWTLISPLAGYLVGLVASILMTRLDWLSYMLVDDWINTVQGKAFQDAAAKLQNAPANATPEEIAALEKAQVDAFRDVVKLGSPVTP